MKMPIVSRLPIRTKGVSFTEKIKNWLFEPIKWKLEEDYIFYFAGLRYFIPKGFIFDGASIPRIFWSFLSPVGLLFIAAIFHDFGYKYGGFLYLEDNNSLTFQLETKHTIDWNFNEMNNDINGMKILNFIALTAVKLAFFTWDMHRERNLSVDDLFESEDYYSRSFKMPPDSYNYPVEIIFKDGHKTFSDGGSVRDVRDIVLWKPRRIINK